MLTHTTITILLATCITLSQSQLWLHQFDTGWITGQSFDRSRRVSRRVGSLSQSQQTENIVDLQDSRRRMFKPLFRDESDINDAYRMIDPLKFTIIPAVPIPTPSSNQNNQQQNNLRSQKSLKSTKKNFFFPTSTLKPIAAVPQPTKEHSNSLFDTKQNNMININDNNDNIRQQGNLNAIKQSQEERKTFRKCHGRCVQKFCLPVGDLTKHNVCQNSCKDICSV